MPIFSSAFTYLESCTTIQSKIAAIDAIIDALLITMAKAATKENFSQYSLNDGQTIINASYRSVKDIELSIEGLDRLKQMYLNRLNGRMVRLVDSKAFPGYNPGFNGHGQ